MMWPLFSPRPEIRARSSTLPEEPTCTADTLEVRRGVAAQRSENDRGEVTEIDAHLQRWALRPHHRALQGRGAEWDARSSLVVATVNSFG